MTGEGGSLPTFFSASSVSMTSAFLPRGRRQRSGVSRDPCKHKQLSDSTAPLGRQQEMLPSSRTRLGRWHCRGDSNPWLPRLLLPDAERRRVSVCRAPAAPALRVETKSQGTPGCKGPANQHHACVGHSFHTALSPGLKLVHGTGGREEEEEEGECSERRPISALGGRAGASAPGIATPRDGCQLGGRVCHPVTGTNIELQSHSCPRRLCGAILLAQPPSPLLGFLLPVCFPPRDVAGFDFQGQFPQGLLGQVVAEVVEE